MPRPLQRILLTVAVAPGLVACVAIGGTDQGQDAPLAPSFAPDAAASTTADPATSTPGPTEGGTTGDPATPDVTSSPSGEPTSTTAPTPTTTDAPQPSPTTQAPTPTAAPLHGRSSGTDAPDDRTTRLAGSPDWTDLGAAELVAEGGRVTLTVDFAAPPPSSSEDATFNVASFYDLDGDGTIEIEVWANLGPDGWGTAVFDNRAGRASLGDRSPADVTTVDGRLVVDFPWSLLDDAPRWRWALASEYGTPSELGTTLAARDDLPDDDGAITMDTSA